MSHTPGPWMVKHAGNQDEIWSDRGIVAELSLYPQGSRAVGANSRLIAAAPDLLEALNIAKEELCRCADKFGCTMDDSMFPVLRRVNEAIAKALEPTA